MMSVTELLCLSLLNLEPSLRAVRNYQRGRVANNGRRVMIFCALKKGGLQLFQLSLREGHNFSCRNLVSKSFENFLFLLSKKFD